MNLVEVLGAGVAIYVLFWASYVCLMPLSGSVARRVHRPEARVIRQGKPLVAVIIPAHNMEREIGRCIDAIFNCGYPTSLLQIYVVADNCSDDTAKVASECSATVLVRDGGLPGKSYALGWALEQVQRARENKPSPELYVIVDASAKVMPGFVQGLANAWKRGADIVVGRAATDPQNSKWFAQCMGLTLTHRFIQNRAREHLGLSSLIEGRGMAYSSDYINQFGWRLALPDAAAKERHPTEDWRHGVKAAAEGVRVRFSADSVVLTPLRDTLGAATQQGIRWEAGRTRNSRRDGLNLLVQGIRQRNAPKLFAGLDAVQPPVAVLLGAAIGLVAMVTFDLLSGRVLVGAQLAVFVTILYGIAVVIAGAKQGIHPIYVVWAPIYIIWRCSAFVIGMIAGFGRKRTVQEPR